MSSKEKVGPNQPCPCGSLEPETGKRRKYKKCCGSCAGDLHFFVANAEAQKALENEHGHVMIFKDRAIAAACAFQAGWKEGTAEIVPLTPERYAEFSKALPCVIVTAKDYDVSKELPKPEEAAPKPEPEKPKVELPSQKFTFL